MLKDKLELLFLDLDEARGMTRITASPPANVDRLESRVLTINDELGIVVLDVGQAQGIRVGTEWTVTNQGDRTTTLRIIEARPLLCAAIVTGGSLRNLAPGATARLTVDTQR